MPLEAKVVCTVMRTHLGFVMPSLLPLTLCTGNSSSEHRETIYESLLVKSDVFFLFVCLFVCFLATLQHTEFPGQGSDLRCSCDLCRSCSNARSLTHCSGLGIEPVSQRYRDAADPIVPQQELPFYIFLYFIDFI